MRFDVLTIFPQALDSILSIGVIGQARDAGSVELHLHDLRDYSDDPHRTVDDRPYGGGAGMLLRVDPFVRGLEAVRAQGARGPAVLVSAQGRLFRQDDATRWAASGGLILLCGRYEGVDVRILHFVDDEVSIGDYVIAGGESAAAVLIEATARMTPGVVGKFESVATDSFYDETRLGAPQYTRPPVFRGHAVPEVLLSGDHAKIDAYRRREAWRKTAKNRPELLGLFPKREDERDG
ncbi:MAG: tRNA (guanosine(37)-N1)-methyltransferase TrmD [Candidatus Bipolaricaulia bacterium]